MKRTVVTALSATLALGTFGFLAIHAPGADDKDSASQNAQSDKASQETAQFPSGVKLKDNPSKEDRSGILKPLKTATEAALTKDGFDDLVERLVDQDRNRLGKEGITKEKFDDLNQKLAAIRDAYKAKYGKDFKLDRDEAFTHVATIAGEVQEPQVVAANWPVAPVSPAAGEAVNAAAKEAGKTDANLDSNIEKGRDVAIATIPASHGLPALHCSLVQELGGWKIDIPNNITGQQLHDNLLKHLNHISDMQAKWPVDENAASLAFAHHILMGVYGVDVDANKKQGDKSDRAGDAPNAPESKSASDSSK
jgi:hypothetical protein